jgi:serine/threonine protein kinase
MEIARFLRLAIRIVAALGHVHSRRLVHKDVKPANILVNTARDQARLMGLGIASSVPRERQSLQPPEFVAGTLAYMAPEQTGRMNRSVDSRSDLYALGVTFYEMLTGTLPFMASDPMELVHCHIARQPTPPGVKLKRDTISGERKYALTAYSVSSHSLLKSSFARTDTLAPVLECRTSVAVMGWRRRFANVANSRSNSR